MVNKIDAVIFDIDGTISDCTHRLHHIQKEKPDWDAFHEECGKDEPIYPIIRLVNIMYSMGFKIIFCTGRMITNIEKTQAWINFHNIPCHQIFMREKDDYRSDYVIKQEMLDDILKEHEVHFAYEDRDRVVKMYRENNITCLQVKEGDY